MRFLVTAALLSFLLQPALSGECMRLVPEQRHPGGTDGPGAFGPLHGLLTLGCVRFIDAVRDGDLLVAVLVDERNKQYRVTPGTWIGENGGRITEITEQRITLNQIVQNAKGEWMEVPRYIFREAAK
jgi:hypothetical protein